MSNTEWRVSTYARNLKFHNKGDMHPTATDDAKSIDATNGPTPSLVHQLSMNDAKSIRVWDWHTSKRA